MGGGDKSAERSGAVAILLYALSISEFMTGSGISDMDSELELSAVTAEMKPRLRRISDCFQTICACYSHLSSLRLTRSSGAPGCLSPEIGASDEVIMGASGMSGRIGMSMRSRYLFPPRMGA